MFFTHSRSSCVFPASETVLEGKIRTFLKLLIVRVILVISYKRFYYKSVRDEIKQKIATEKVQEINQNRFESRDNFSCDVICFSLFFSLIFRQTRRSKNHDVIKNNRWIASRVLFNFLMNFITQPCTTTYLLLKEELIYCLEREIWLNCKTF